MLAIKSIPFGTLGPNCAQKSWTLHAGPPLPKAAAMTDRLKALKYRARYRGTREADALVGGFFDAHAAHWGEAELAWFEALVAADDEDIMAWALSRADPPAPLADPVMLAALRRLDYIAAP
jgi:antitoxin CptB